MANQVKRTFTGKVAFVTGAGGGIGRAAALGFAREGASLVVADVSEKENQETARLIEEQGGRALAVRCDVTRIEDVKAALDKTAEAFGRLDFAFNNAGIEPKKPAPTADYDLDEWERIIAIDLRGVFLCMKYEIPLMLKNGGGAIVNTSSGAGVIGIKGSPAYTAAKHGVIGLTRAMARELGPSGIRVNALAPGFTLTQTNLDQEGDVLERADAIRRGQCLTERNEVADDLAGPAFFLASPDSDFVTGQTLLVDGGLNFN